MGMGMAGHGMVGFGVGYGAWGWAWDMDVDEYGYGCGFGYGGGQGDEDGCPIPPPSQEEVACGRPREFEGGQGGPKYGMSSGQLGEVGGRPLMPPARRVPWGKQKYLETSLPGWV